MIELEARQQATERSDAAAIRSHESKDKAVYAICHHTGDYLTRAETNPQPMSFFKERHDFPGLPKLDKLFAKAAHSKEAQHSDWNVGLFLALALTLLAPFMAVLANTVGQSTLVQPFRFFLLSILILGTLALPLAALWILFNRSTVYHWLATGSPPKVSDYPLNCNYKVKAVEEVFVDLGNERGLPPEVKGQRCRLETAVTPKESDIEDYESYRRVYNKFDVGKRFFAGTLALDNLTYVDFSRYKPKLDHQIPLRAGIDYLLDSEEPVTFKVGYQVHRDAFYSWRDEWERFPLACEPQLWVRSSRGLVLRFQWWGDEDVKLVLDSCELTVPDELGKAKVQSGLFDSSGEKAVWRKRPFTKRDDGSQICNLFLSFDKPILQYPEKIAGKYRVVVKDNLISGMQIKPENIWTAWGLKAGKDGNKIEQKTIFEGDLSIDPQQLSQANEYLQTESPRSLPVAPNEETVQAVMEVLIKHGWDIRRVARAMPRLSPTGGINRRLHYWSLIGRSYQAKSLEAIGVHIVLSGYEEVTQGGDETLSLGNTKIDLRVGCLHDPRNQQTPARVDAWVGKGTKASLLDLIEKEVMG